MDIVTDAWRLLLTGPGEPGFNMALDEALSVAVRRRWSTPTLRIYQWQQPAVSLGCHQPLSVLERLEDPARGWWVVRRPTAGGAVLHQRDVSYALACDRRTLGGMRSRHLYQRFHAALGRALATSEGQRRYQLSDATEPAVPESSICFQQPVRDDLMVGARKVAGAAQRRWRDGLLQQGTVVEPAVSRDRLALCIRAAWAAVFSCRFIVGMLTVQEHLLVDELWSKYRPWTPSSWPPVSQSALNR